MNVSNNRNESVPELYNGAGVILPLCIMSVEGVAGNLLLIAAIISDRKLRTYIDMFVCNVAVMDLIVSGILLPTKIPSLVHDENYYNKPACRFFAVLTVVSCVGSVVSLALVALNKYLFVCHHVLYARLFNKKVSLVVLCFSWAYPIAVACPMVLGWSRVVYSPFSASCVFDSGSKSSYSTFLAVFGLGLPTITTITCYLGIFFKMYQSRRKVEENQQMNNTRTSKDKDHQGTSINKDNKGASEDKDHQGTRKDKDHQQTSKASCKRFMRRICIYFYIDTIK